MFEYDNLNTLLYLKKQTAVTGFDRIVTFRHPKEIKVKYSFFSDGVMVYTSREKNDKEKQKDFKW